MATGKLKIVKQNLILCEGVDELYFLIAYLNNVSTEKSDLFKENIQVMDFGGIKDLKSFLMLLKNMEQYENVKSIMIIRDAEKDCKIALRDVETALKAAQLPVPEGPGEWAGEQIKIGYLLFPNLGKDVREGTLEDLCLEILSEESPSDVLVQIENFTNFLEDENLRNLKWKHKSKLHTYFSVTNDYVGSKIGEAAQKQAFNWESEKLKPMTRFIERI
ncbi:MAG: DUF3226 domain-containing protein [Erysipelotrichaceae bacterium]